MIQVGFVSRGFDSGRGGLCRVGSCFLLEGGVLKFINVVNNDTTMHAVHTCTVAFSTPS